MKPNKKQTRFVPFWPFLVNQPKFCRKFVRLQHTVFEAALLSLADKISAPCSFYNLFM
jgi:hypothetical protein